jgi:hypothetical protein
MKKIYFMKSQKKIKLFVIFSIISFLSNAQAPTPDVLHYKFDGVGSSITNYASSPPSGTATGTIIGAQTQTGSVNCINALVGTSGASTTDYVNTGWAPNISGSWTISFWTSNITPSTTLFYIFGDVNSSSLRCFTNGVAGANNWILRGGFTDVLLNGAATTTPNLVTFVYDQTAANIIGYINAVPSVTVAQTAAPLTGTGPFKVGGYSSSTGLNAGGLMGDFRIYSSALSAAQVLSIYNYNATPTVSISGTNILCAGATTSLTASGANFYSWSSGETTAIAALSPTINTTYTVIGTSGSCTASAVSSVTVNSLPIISVNSGSICAGQSFTMVPTGATTYTYSNGTDVVIPASNDSYTVTGTDANGCVSATGAVSTVTVNSLPIISVNSGSICAGQSFTMVPTGATTYTYSNGTDVVIPASNDSYTVTGTDANGCVSATGAVSTVTVNALPVLTAATNNTLLCVGQTATLSVSGATTYTWSTTENTTSIAVSPTVQTTYTVNGTDANGCSNNITVTQNVSACTGIATLSNDASINVYPNPNNGLFTLELTTTSKVTVTNALGQVVITETFEAGKHNLDIHNETTGVYFVKVIENNKQQIIKVIKE